MSATLQDCRAISWQWIKDERVTWRCWDPGGENQSMGDLQDPNMEVLYHISGHILWGYSLKFRPYIGLIYGWYLRFRIMEWPLNQGENHASTATNLCSKKQDPAVHHKNLAQIAAKKAPRKVQLTMNININSFKLTDTENGTQICMRIQCENRTPNSVLRILCKASGGHPNFVASFIRFHPKYPIHKLQGSSKICPFLHPCPLF